MGVHDKEHLRKQVGGIALIASPVLGLIGAGLAPRLDSDEATWLANIADATDRASFATVINVLSITAAVFAVLALTHMLRERGTTYGQVGGALSVIGLVLTTMFLGMEAFANELARSSIDPVAASTLLRDASTNPVSIVAYAGSAVFTVGMLTLAVGLYRAQAVPALCAFGIGLFSIGIFAAYAAFLSPLLIASFAVLTVALVPVGWQVLEETDQAWEHTPTFRGFHPQAA